LRHAAEVTARAQVEAVWRAGGEPVIVHPHAPQGRVDAEQVAAPLARFDAVLLPGGGDLTPHRYGAGQAHETVYDVNDEQDGFDLALGRQALGSGLPLLAVCRGLQVVNVALSGTLEQDMGGVGGDHRHVVHPVALVPGSVVERTAGAER
jgi:putative glutamine amidotransferase